jgi:hypothetical protein
MGGASNDVAILVLIIVIFSIQQTLCKLDWEMNCDPVLGGVIVDVLNTTLTQPIPDQSAGLLGRLDELVDLVSTEMVPVFGVIRVRRCPS